MNKEFKLEEMSVFFTARIEEYDSHMINDVEGCKEGYLKMAECVKEDTKILLDLGCGTGLELDEIFKKVKDIEVTGIDLTKAMLDKLKEKYRDKNLNLILGDYFDIDFGVGKFDCAVSFQTMHHFTYEKKVKLYKKIYNSLRENGEYIECDYMVESQEEQDYYLAENERLRKNQNIKENEFYHYDTPFTIKNQITMLKEAGFKEARIVFRKENTTMLVANKSEVAY